MIYSEDSIWAVEFDHFISDNQETDSNKVIKFQIHSELCELTQASRRQMLKHWENNLIMNVEQFLSSKS